MSVQIDCTVDLVPTPIAVTLLPSSSIDVALLSDSSIAVTMLPSPSIDVALSPVSPIAVTLLPSSSFDVSFVPPSHIDVNYGHQGIQGPVGPVGPQGPSGVAQAVWGETPIGSINGTNKSYTTANPYTPGLLAVFLNGLRLRRANDYVETGNQSFQFLSAPLTGDSLSIDYM